MGVVRVVLLVIAGLLITGGITLVMLVVIPAGIALIGWGVLLLIGLLIERWRYKLLGERRPGPDWTATGERFIDPETGKLVAVYYRPRSGERRYVAL
jgi:hypothetical protein